MSSLLITQSKHLLSFQLRSFASRRKYSYYLFLAFLNFSVQYIFNVLASVVCTQIKFLRFVDSSFQHELGQNNPLLLFLDTLRGPLSMEDAGRGLGSAASLQLDCPFWYLVLRSDSLRHVVSNACRSWHVIPFGIVASPFASTKQILAILRLTLRIRP